MALTMEVVSLLCLSSALCFAESISGVLVDSKCYAAEERNVNPTDTETYVDRDGNFEIRYCHPREKTKSFTVVPPDGQSFELVPPEMQKRPNWSGKPAKSHDMKSP